MYSIFAAILSFFELCQFQYIACIRNATHTLPPSLPPSLLPSLSPFCLKPSIFAAILFFFELCQFQYIACIDNVFRRNFGFMYGSRGKALYIIL